MDHNVQIQTVLTGSSLTTLKDYLLNHSEQTFALLILLSAVTVTYLIPYKLVFLNLFFIIILLGAYYLEAHRAVLGGVLTTLLVVIYVYYYPSSFMAANTERDLWLNILAWSSLLFFPCTASGDQKRAKWQTEKQRQPTAVVSRLRDFFTFGHGYPPDGLTIDGLVFRIIRPPESTV